MIHYMTTRGVGDAWVAQELRCLVKAAIPFALHSLRRPDATYFVADDIGEMNQRTRVVYPLPFVGGVGAVLSAPALFRGRFFAALWNALTGPRESPRVRAAGLWHFVTACHFASKLRAEDVRQIHSQWIHSGGTVAMYGAWLLGVPFSFTGHAADLFRERAALEDKVRRAAFIVCISSFHRQFFLDLGARPEQLITVYCGIDTKHFTPRRRQRAPGEPYRILSSGRLVEKKGFESLIRACALLQERGVNFECVIGGSGPLEASLRQMVADEGLSARVRLTGEALKQESIPDFMYGGDVYCLPCVWAADRDVDGLPQMLMEAMACGLPAISTRLVGIPDLVIHEETGLLVEPRDAGALADALIRLLTDDALAGRLAKAGHDHVLARFDLDTCMTPLFERFRARLEAA